MLPCFCALDINLRLTNLTQTPRVPTTTAQTSNGSIIGTVSPTPAIITLAEINAVSTPSVTLIPRLYFYIKLHEFMTSLSFINCFSISEIFCNR